VITLAAYGRLTADPRQIKTSTGKAMAVANIAVNLTAKDEQVTEFMGLVAFSRQADELTRMKKGDLLTASGKLQINQWEKDGEQKRQLQIVVDAIVSARTTRPAGRAKVGGVA
jgi:single-strand DNA-binding protein